ncbi:MAG: hypothetical protein H7329_20775 [Opitutaceae bacterium]|nr:hypothetical protein [Cytophagales bacterium]
MKKSLISLSLITALALSVNAQDATTTTTTTTTSGTAAAAPSGSEFKPSAGNVTFEVNAMSPFNGGTGDRALFSLNNGLRFRYFINEGLAFRLNFSITRSGFNKTYSNTNTFVTTTPGVGATPSNTTTTTTVDDNIIVKSRAFEFSIAPGIEKHNNISERLSVYYGAYIDFTINSKKGSIEVSPGSTSKTQTALGTTPDNSSNFSGSFKEEIKGAYYGDNAPATATFASATRTFTGPTRDKNAGFTRIGLFGVIGADYYITKALYLGLEASWGVSSTSYKAVEVNRTGSIGAGATTAVPAPTAATDYSSKDDGKKGGSSLVITPNVNASFRLGFWF